MFFFEIQATSILKIENCCLFCLKVAAN